MHESFFQSWAVLQLLGQLQRPTLLRSQMFNGVRDGKMWDVEEGEIPGTVAAASQTLA